MGATLVLLVGWRSALAASTKVCVSSVYPRVLQCALPMRHVSCVHMHAGIPGGPGRGTQRQEGQPPRIPLTPALADHPLVMGHTQLIGIADADAERRTRVTLPIVSLLLEEPDPSRLPSDVFLSQGCCRVQAG